MAALVCDLCGGKLVMGAGGVATCDSCGMEHSADRMKEKVQEVKGVVQTDSSHLVTNYLDMAINAIDAGNNVEAEAYCNKIIEVDPTNYRAWMLRVRQLLGSLHWQILELVKALTRLLKALSMLRKKKGNRLKRRQRTKFRIYALQW